MAYTITLTNGNVLTVVNDATIDTTTSLSLVGRNYANYGTAIATNFVRLLENAANSTAPAAPLTGQLWYNTTGKVMKVWDGSAWQVACFPSPISGADGSIINFPLAIQGSSADNVGLVLINLTANANSRRYRMRVRDDGLYAGHVVLEALNDNGTIKAVALDCNSSGICFVSEPAASDTTAGRIATVQFVKAQGYAPLASPAFTGTPTAPTPSSGDSTTKIATTAFVANNFAKLVSPAFTGTPTAPTAAAGTNTTQIATTAFVQTATSDNYVHSGGGTGQQPNHAIYLGWDGTAPKLQVDATDLGRLVRLSDFTRAMGTTGDGLPQGWFKQPDGTILQFTTVRAFSSGAGLWTTSWNLPIAFPNYFAFTMICYTGGTPPYGTSIAVVQNNNASVLVTTDSTGGGTTTLGCIILAVGY